MRAFVEPLEELSGFEEMTHNMQQDGLISITGCIDAQKPHMIYGVGNGRKNKIIFMSRKQKNYTRITAFLIRRLSTIRQRMFCFTSPISGEIC